MNDRLDSREKCWARRLKEELRVDTLGLGYLWQNERDRNTDYVLHHQSQVRGYPKTRD
jgi:hypothetical protein